MSKVMKKEARSEIQHDAEGNTNDELYALIGEKVLRVLDQEDYLEYQKFLRDTYIEILKERL